MSHLIHITSPQSTHAQTHTRTHTDTHAHTRTHTLTHGHTRSHTHTHSHTHAHIKTPNSSNFVPNEFFLRSREQFRKSRNDQFCKITSDKLDHDFFWQVKKREGSYVRSFSIATSSVSH